MQDDLEDRLGVRELREGFLEYSRRAHARVARGAPRRMLDIGCGRGGLTIELGRLGPGQVVGMDVDADALLRLRRRIEDESLGGRVSAVRCSLRATGFRDGGFDVLWAEGVLHMLEREDALRECRRLLARGGHLVVAETVTWIESLTGSLPGLGFERAATIPWRTGCWWTDYYAPLEQRLRRFREQHPAARDLPALRRYENEVDMVRRNPAGFDCAHLVLRKADNVVG
jgi:ubiquinone/menaquinone biosynthesis C-methylase UbiE